MSELRQLLYVSRLCEGFDAAEVTQILRTARRANAIHGETGVLLFDGARFAQLLEGPPEALRKLLRNLLGDPRHDDVRILTDLPIAARRYQDFRMGYATLDDVSAVDRLALRASELAVDEFAELAASSEISL